jgi:hypothetical protein
MPNDQRRSTTAAPTTPSKSSPGADDRDSHGTPFNRVPGPGPKDAGKGAAGADAIDRAEGGLERVQDQGNREGDTGPEEGE